MGTNSLSQSGYGVFVHPGIVPQNASPKLLDTLSAEDPLVLFMVVLVERMDDLVRGQDAGLPILNRMVALWVCKRHTGGHDLWEEHVAQVLPTEVTVDV